MPDPVAGAFQVRSISDPETAVAVKLQGAEGGILGVEREGAEELPWLAGVPEFVGGVAPVPVVGCGLATTNGAIGVGCGVTDALGFVPVGTVGEKVTKRGPKIRNPPMAMMRRVKTRAEVIKKVALTTISLHIKFNKNKSLVLY